MAFPDFGGALQRLGLRLVGVVRTQFGAGVTSKSAAVMCVAIIGFVVLGIFMPESTYKPLTITGFAVFCLVWFVGTWIHTSVNPLHAVEGQQLVQIYRDTIAAKGLNVVPDTPAITNPAYTEILDTPNSHGEP